MRALTGFGLCLLLAACGNGADGKTAVVRVAPESAGANCVSGGVAVQTGLDANRNGSLDTDEVDASQTRYVCQGPAGAAGATGSAGPAGGGGSNGADGTDGTNGTNGSSGSGGPNGAHALSTLTAEPAGANCRYGGTRIDAGVDRNGNSVLESSEITSTSYLCLNESVDGMYFGDVSVHVLADLSQLDGVQTLFGSLNIERGFTGSVVVTDLQKISDSLQVEGIGGGRGLSAATVSFPNLTEVGDVSVYGADQLIAFSAPKLAQANRVSINDNPLLTTLDLPALERVGGALDEGDGRIEVRNNALLATLSFPAMGQLNYLEVFDNEALQTISMPALVTITGDLEVGDNDALISVNMPELIIVMRSADISGNDALQTLAMPKLQEVTEGFAIQNNPLLGSCAANILVRDVKNAELSVTDGNGPATCTARAQCKVIAVGDHTDLVYQCAVPANFEAGRQVCLELGTSGDLYWAESAAEWAAFRVVALNRDFKVGSYLGYSDLAVDGTWVATSGFTGYDPTAGIDFWAPGQPGGLTEFYTQLFRGGLVGDSADLLARPICRVAP